MRKFLKSIIALTLAFLTAFLGTAQVLADNQPADDEGQYISEVKVALGGSAEDDLTAEGFTILCDDSGDPVDLNQGAGGGKNSPGDKKVLLGYKTTTDISEAITDLALMNMEGGYSVDDYDLLMKNYMGAQISPFIDRFIVAINEYRENIKSDDESNRQRAEYIRTVLNKFTDDDCGGAGLGDLLLNETVYEMAKPEFDKLPAKAQEEKGISGVNNEVRDKLPEAEKNKHCDILTLFAQADGQIMLVIYDLITRAADTSDDSWIDRFSGMSYNDLLDSYDMPPTDARKQAAKDFEDDARIILKSWDDFRTLLLGADEDVEAINDTEMPDTEAVEAKLDSLDDNSSPEEIVDALEDVIELQSQASELYELTAAVTVADYLESIEYGDGTMYDSFTRSTSEVTADITSLYPLVAALSPGQRSGVEFISLRELVMLGNRDAEYSDEELNDLEPTSVYEGVDRGIYQKGGVALTSDTLRTRALQRQQNRADRNWISTKTIVLYAVTGAMAAGFIGSIISWGVRSSRITKQFPQYKDITSTLKWMDKENALAINVEGNTIWRWQIEGSLDKLKPEMRPLVSAANTAKWMAVGFAAVTFIMAGLSAYMTWQDLKDYYKVDYAVIPRYMVDEVSITYTNERGEKLVKPNQAAYYEAVKCYRKESDKNFKALGDCADMNGDVGQQWLALYACRNYEEMQPILADSLKVVVDSSDIPAGYDNRGIHMFGSESAFNLNSKLYDWNQDAKSVFVYYKIDDTAPLGGASTSGSAFSAGRTAITAVCGAGLGAIVTALAMTAYRKKKDRKEPAAA